MPCKPQLSTNRKIFWPVHQNLNTCTYFAAGATTWWFNSPDLAPYVSQATESFLQASPWTVTAIAAALMGWEVTGPSEAAEKLSSQLHLTPDTCLWAGCHCGFEHPAQSFIWVWKHRLERFIWDTPAGQIAQRSSSSLLHKRKVVVTLCFTVGDTIWKEESCAVKNTCWHLHRLHLALGLQCFCSTSQGPFLQAFFLFLN